MPEILLILAIALIVIGPQKLPEVAKTLGKALGEFKRSAQDLKNSIDIETTVKEVKPKPASKKLKDVIKDIGTDDPKSHQASGEPETSDSADDLKTSTSPDPAQNNPGTESPTPDATETETEPPKA